jgi:16S rRNA (guanine527-N7)-methyltransferase
VTDDTPRRETEAALRAGADALGVSLDDSQVERLLAYLEAMLDWNTKVNLTAVREPAAAVERHLVDSLSLVPVWHAVAGDAPPRRVLDLGTGGGFPGAPLAVAWPSARVLQIDGTLKKVKIVNDCLNRAGIANASALQCRGDALPAMKPDAKHGFDLCVARAVGPAPKLLEELWKLTATDGVIVLMKGAEPPEDEIAAAREVAARRHLVELPPHRTGLPGGQQGAALVYRSQHRPSERPKPTKPQGRWRR